MTDDEKKLEQLKRQLSQARPYAKQTIIHQIELQQRLIEHKKTLGDRIVAHATKTGATVQAQAIIDSTQSLVEALNGAADLMSSESRQLSLAIKAADRGSSLLGRTLVIVGTAAWFSLAWDIAKTIANEGVYRFGILAVSIVLVAALLKWCGILDGLFRREQKANSGADQPRTNS